MKNRAIQRGKPLDKDCYGCKTTTHEYGPSDDRVFCYGLVDMASDELFEKCRVCGAYAFNSKPLEDFKNEKKK